MPFHYCGLFCTIPGIPRPCGHRIAVEGLGSYGRGILPPVAWQSDGHRAAGGPAVLRTGIEPARPGVKTQGAISQHTPEHVGGGSPYLLPRRRSISKFDQLDQLYPTPADWGPRWYGLNLGFQVYGVSPDGIEPPRTGLQPVALPSELRRQKRRARTLELSAGTGPSVRRWFPSVRDSYGIYRTANSD